MYQCTVYTGAMKLIKVQIRTIQFSQQHFSKFTTRRVMLYGVIWTWCLYLLFFRGGSLNFNLIYSMLNFCLEDFVLFLFVLLNKQTIWTWTILKYKLCIICKSYVTVHILRPKVKSRCSFEVWIILSLRNKYLQVILHDTVWFRHDVQSWSLCTTHGVSKLFIN